MCDVNVVSARFREQYRTLGAISDVNVVRTRRTPRRPTLGAICAANVGPPAWRTTRSTLPRSLAIPAPHPDPLPSLPAVHERQNPRERAAQQAASA
jgi:hypothetical protein